MSDETPTPETPAAEPAATAPETPAAPAAETPAAAPAPAAETPAAASAPTEPEIPVTAAAPAAPAAAAVTAPVATPEPAKATHVAVPKWLLTTVAAVVGAGVMFGIGYAVGDGSSSDNNTPSAVGTPFGNQGNGNQQMPSFPGQGNGNQQNPFGNQGNGNQGNGNQQTPQSPNQSASGAFLGVATQQTNSGLEIIQVVSGSAADDAGLEVGDVIVEFDGNQVTTPAQLANAVGNLDPGDEVKITYERDGSSRTTTVELGSRSTTNSN